VAFGTKAGLRGGKFALVAFALAGAGNLMALVSLEQATERRAGDFAPVMEGEVVAVVGTVSAKPMLYPLFAHLAIQDEYGHGLLLEGNFSQFTGLQPGLRVEAKGTVSKRAGVPVLSISHIDAISRGSAPAPRKVSLPDMHSFRDLGLLVSVEGRVVDKGDNTQGDYLLIGDVHQPLKVLLPRGAARPASLDRFEIGDRVRASGIASQYCPFPPYDRSFQLVLADDDDIVLTTKRWLISPEWFSVSVAFLVFALGLWWMRERRMAAQRNMVRTFYTLGEDVIGVMSPAEMLNRLTTALPEVLKISGLSLYLYNRSARQLDRVRQTADSLPFSVPVYAPEGSLPVGAAVAFRNQALLTILDTRRSPFFPDGRPESQPGSVMCVPMFAESEVLGVLELYDIRAEHEFSRDERILSQHLANQMGIALRLMEEKSIREQLYRSEKLAAVGQLISGIAAELKSPLDSISTSVENIQTTPANTLWSEVAAISGEARKASDIVARLVSFMQPERAEPKRIELNGLVRSLIEFRRQEWETRGFIIEEALSPSPIHILGSQGQIERVFLDLLVQAEHALSESSDKRLGIASSILGRRAVVEIGYVPGLVNAPWEGLANAYPSLHIDAVSRGIVNSHGGELRISHTAEGVCRIELELPIVPAKMTASGGAARALTCLVVEPDGNGRDGLVRALTQRGCRVIPAAGAEDGAELVQRLRFDIVFCAVRLPGLNWIEFSESIQNEVGAFVLLTEGFDFELSRGLLSTASYILSKPVVEPELDHLLAAVEARLSSPEARLRVIRPPEQRRASGEPY
jgi:signal transduction histidine kinase